MGGLPERDQSLRFRVSANSDRAPSHLRPVTAPWHFTRAGLWIRDLTSAPIGPTLLAVNPTQRNVLVRRAYLSDVHALAMIGASSPRSINRLSAGKCCYVGLAEGSIASYGWVTFDREDIPELEREVRLEPAEAYVWDCFTSPARRGYHLMCQLLRHIAADLRHARYRRIWAIILAGNYPSQRAFQHAGFVQAATISYFRLLCFRHLRVNLAADLPAHLHPAARSFFRPT